MRAEGDFLGSAQIYPLISFKTKMFSFSDLLPFQMSKIVVIPRLGSHSNVSAATPLILLTSLP